MTLTIELPTDLERALTAQAADLGVPIEQYALGVLKRQVPLGDSVKTGADLVAYWEREGVIGIRPDIVDRDAHARSIRTAAERRVRAES